MDRERERQREKKRERGREKIEREKERPGRSMDCKTVGNPPPQVKVAGLLIGSTYNHATRNSCKS